MTLSQDSRKLFSRLSCPSRSSWFSSVRVLSRRTTRVHYHPSKRRSNICESTASFTQPASVSKGQTPRKLGGEVGHENSNN
jgi:hypothetical protein